MDQLVTVPPHSAVATLYFVQGYPSVPECVSRALALRSQEREGIYFLLSTSFSYKLCCFLFLQVGATVRHTARKVTYLHPSFRTDL